MVVFWGARADLGGSLRPLLAELGLKDIRILDAHEPIDAHLDGARGVVVLEDDVTPAALAAVAAARDAARPTAVLFESLFTQNLPALLAAGAHWTGTNDGPASVIQALEKLGLVDPGASPYEPSWGCVDLRPQDPRAFSRIITGDAATLAALGQAELASPTPQTVLVTGETGTGKDLVAKAIHDASGRSGRFVAENVSGLDDTLFSDALFGHVRGSYTGAHTGRQGLVRSAQAGTLFLDEVGDLTPASQTKLLRLLENREYYPIGSDRPVRTDARFVVATHQDLVQRVRDGSFRRDLYFRLRVHEIHMPPLSRRGCDLEPLARFFAAQVAAEQGVPAPEITEGFVSCLHSYSFPGNVRELRSMIYRAVTTSRGEPLSSNHFSPALAPMQPVRTARPGGHERTAHAGETVRFAGGELPTIDDVVGMLIDEALERTDGNQSAAARLIGLTPSAVNKRLRARGGH